MGKNLDEFYESLEREQRYKEESFWVTRTKEPFFLLLSAIMATMALAFGVLSFMWMALSMPEFTSVGAILLASFMAILVGWFFLNIVIEKTSGVFEQRRRNLEAQWKLATSDTFSKLTVYYLLALLVVAPTYLAVETIYGSILISQVLGAWAIAIALSVLIVSVWGSIERRKVSA